MYTIRDIVKHIECVYGFVETPCSIPANNFQHLKRSFYIFIYGINKNLFYFMRDKISPIKFLEERPLGQLWFTKRDVNNHIIFEVEVIPYRLSDEYYVMDIEDIFIPFGRNFRIRISCGCDTRSFPINLLTGIKSIDVHFSHFPELKTELRNYKLNYLL